MKKPFVIYPFLLVIFPILFLYSHNIDQVRFSQTLLPTAIMLAFTLVLLLLLSFIFRNSLKSALIVAIFLVLFFSYGHVLEKIEIWDIKNFSSPKHLLAAWAVLFAAGVYFTLRTRKELFYLTKISNVIAFSLVAISLVNIAAYQLKKNSTWRDNSVRAGNMNNDTAIQENTANLRDIYYIILDAYASSSVLKEVYGFDNHKFTDYLTEKGFYIASQSRSNYATTFLSLASSLNMEYVNYLCDAIGIQSKDREIPYQMIRNNKVVSFLREKGYKFIHFSSGWGATDYNKSADLDLRFGWGSEFIMVFIKTTALAYLEDYFARHDARVRILGTLSKLGEVHNINGPKFVFAHLVCPHPPYLFDANGGMVSNAILEMDGRMWEKRQLYIDQLNFINGKVKELLESILSNSKTEPIIILQADHGSASLGRPHPPLKKTEKVKNEVKERMRIFNAYYLPAGGNALLYDSISPVNTFRLIFDFYFGSDYGLLSDISYYADYDTPYLLTDVTDIFPNN
jgi:hypothetical protein